MASGLLPGKKMWAKWLPVISKIASNFVKARRFEDMGAPYLRSQRF